MQRLVHLMNGLEVGGRERVVVQLAQRGRREGLDHRIVLYDSPFRGVELDLDPGDVPVHFIQRGPGVDLRFAGALAKLLAELRCEIVHAHNDTAIFYGCVAALRLGLVRPAVIATFHTRPRHATTKARWSTRLVSRRARTITAVSEDMARLVVDEGWVRSCEVVRNGIDLREFSPDGPLGGWRERLGLAREDFVVAHIARFDGVKRHIDLLQAAALLAQLAPRVQLVLVGQGPLEDEIHARARQLTNVHFVPRIVDVAAFLREIELFVLCSEHEAMPRVLLEAMSCERPCLATAVGGVPEMLVDAAGAACGRLVPPRQPAELARAIAELSGDPATCAALARRGRARAADFSAEREWTSYVELYRAALAR
ncbi:MAG: glycosyltransferase [Planctomycetes bacterium]|nr:glycosyltransferase [Planctomycetota bacterium]